nr:ABC transporter ATP-binding protein [Planococcus halocryophilus]
MALARALIVEPKVLLLDEPLSALDAQIRKKLQADLRSIQSQMGITMILVTHDQEEAMAVSDKIFVMNKGEIAQWGTPTDIYTKPKTEFIANFIGHYNVFSKTELEELIGKSLTKTGDKLAIRPEAILFEGTVADYRLKAVAKKSVMSGNVIRTVFLSGDREFSVEQLHHRGHTIEVGKEYDCYISPEDVIYLQ